MTLCFLPQQNERNEDAVSITSFYLGAGWGEGGVSLFFPFSLFISFFLS